MNKAQTEFLDTLLIDFIETHTTDVRCDLCGAVRAEHRIEDCPVKLAVELREQLN